jgi:hypothetical protein
MPALVKSRFGLSGMRLDEGTMVCCFDRKKSRNDWRICVLVIMAGKVISNQCSVISWLGSGAAGESGSPLNTEN